MRLTTLFVHGKPSRVERMVVNRVNPRPTAFLAGMIILGTWGAAGQTPPLGDPAVAQKPLAPLGSSSSAEHKGLFTIDVVVTDAAGNPVSDLAARDFTLLDNGQPATIRTLHTPLAPSEPLPESAPEVIFVLDTVNLSPQQLMRTESAMVHFMRKDGGHLRFPCFLYRLTRDGLFSSLRPVMDGALLVEELEQKRSQLTVWSAERREVNSLGSWDSGLPRNRLALRALGSIAIHQRDVPGRKVVVWIGPGWPVLGNGDSDFGEITELSTRLREAHITLDSVTGWPNPEAAAFDYHRFLEAPRSQKDMQPAKMALPVIATHTGGLVLDPSDDLDREIERCVEAEQSFYTLTFNPPHTSTMDEYHDLRVQVARPGLAVRAPTGYYNEPVYFDSPRPGIEKVNVAQLEELVHSGTDLLRKLENLELTERLSTPRLDALLSVVRSERERQALTAAADLSFALAPPPDEIVGSPVASGGGATRHSRANIRLPSKCHSQTARLLRLENHGALRRASGTRQRELEDAAPGPDSPLRHRGARDGSLSKRRRGS